MTTPYPFQIRDANRIQEFGGRCLLASDMGLGKSLTTLLWAKKYLDHGPVIIVCPATLKVNWQRECRLHFGIRAEIIHGRTPPPGGLKNHPSKWYIGNYDILGDPTNPDSWVSALYAIRPTLVIGDECHMIKSKEAQRTKAFRHLCRRSPHVICVSGTPMTNRPAELFPSLNILRPDLYSSFWSFGTRYCAPRRTHFGWDFRGASHLDELHESLKSTMMVRTLKKEVMKDLPSETRRIVPLEIDRRKEYTMALTQFIRWLRKQSKSRAKKAVKAERLVQLGYLRRLAGSLKVKNVVKWIQDFFEESDEKLILFAVHKTVIKEVHDRFKKISVVVDGSITGAKRQKAIDAFNVDTRTRLLIGNIQAAGVGWSCKSTSQVAFAELPWVPGELTQAEKRVHGIGRGKGNAQYTYLVADDTIEMDLIKILQNKQNVLDHTLDGKAGISRFDILSKLESALVKKVKVRK